MSQSVDDEADIDWGGDGERGVGDVTILSAVRGPAGMAVEGVGGRFRSFRKYNGSSSCNSNSSNNELRLLERSFASWAN